MAREAGLDKHSGSPPVPEVDDPSFFLRPALGERGFRVRHGVIATAEQKKVEALPDLNRIKYFPLNPQWWDAFEVPHGIAARVGEVPALLGRIMIKGPADAGRWLASTFAGRSLRPACWQGSSVTRATCGLSLCLW